MPPLRHPSFLMIVGIAQKEYRLVFLNMVVGQVSITINDIEIEKKEAMDEFKERLKPLNEEKQELLDHIKRGSEFVENEECAKILYHEEKMAGFYNKLGELVYSRPIMPQEMQKTVFSINRKTGTES
mgnify:CR=1 FL=1